MFLCDIFLQQNKRVIKLKHGWDNQTINKASERQIFYKIATRFISGLFHLTSVSINKQ